MISIYQAVLATYSGMPIEYFLEYRGEVKIENIDKEIKDERSK